MAACWLRPTAARPSGVGWAGHHEYRLRVAVERWQPGAVLLADFPGRTVRLVSAAHAEPAAEQRGECRKEAALSTLHCTTTATRRLTASARTQPGGQLISRPPITWR